MIRKTCRMCQSRRLTEFLDLGFTPLSDAFLTKYQLNNPEMYYPLRVNSCEDCGLAQLNYVVAPEVLYQRNYPYESSTTRTGREHYHGMAASICDRFKLTSKDYALDVGSNVGVLLQGFKNKGTQVLGVDPATDMAQIANNNGIQTIPTFFTQGTIPDIQEVVPKVRVITGTNVFAHIDDLDDFMITVDAMLADNGILVIEAPTFLHLVKNLEYDTIYHEHVSYVSIKPMQNFFKRFGFELFDVENYPIHGGTIRVFAARKGVQPVSSNVQTTIDEEESEGIYSLDRLSQFAQDVRQHKQKMIQLLQKIKSEGQSIVGISAPAKGNTLLNYCHLDRDLIAYITEKAQVKIGLYTPGTQIPVVADHRLLQDQPDYAMILAWNFAKEIMNNLSEYKNKGGKFIIPIPEPQII